MSLPTEPIGSIPRPPELIQAVQEAQAGHLAQQKLDELYRQALRDTIRRFEETCPGGDQDSTHSADVDYADLLPDLFSLDAGSFYLQMASEPDRKRVLNVVRDSARPGQRLFVGVIDPINSRVETPEEVRDRVLEAAGILGPERLGTTDDCGFSPFGDDVSTARDTAFAKIRARVIGTELASRELRV